MYTSRPVWKLRFSILTLLFFSALAAAALPQPFPKLFLASVFVFTLSAILVQVFSRWVLDTFTAYYLALTVLCTIVYMVCVFYASNRQGLLQSAEYWSIGVKLLFGPLILLMSYRLAWGSILVQLSLCKLLVATNGVLMLAKIITGVATGEVLGGIHSNYMGLTAGLSLGVWLLFINSGVIPKKTLRLLFIASVASLLVSISRGAMLSVIFGSLYFLAFRKYKTAAWLHRLMFLIVVASLLWVSVGFSSWVNSSQAVVFNEFVESVTGKKLDTGRSKLWEVAAFEIYKHPYIGIGMAARESYERELSDGSSITLSIHNYYLAVLLESGIIGLFIVLLLLFVVLCVITSKKNRFSVIGASVFFAVLIHQTSEVAITTGTFTASALIWLVWGGVLSLAGHEKAVKRADIA